MITASPADGAAREFASHHGRAPDGVWSAPGRVNLIGEHTDYNGGFVLPFAIEMRTACAIGHRSDRLITVGSTFTPEHVEAEIDSLGTDGFSGWSAYVLGVVWALRERGVDLSGRPGLDVVVDSNVPVGAGVSSSAALECALASALNDEWELGLSVDELVAVCQLAENGAVGAPTGTMDQTASLKGVAGHAILVDCESNDATLVPLPLAEDGLTMLAIDTRVAHGHADGGYASRRESCEAVAAALGLASLRAADLASLERVRTVVGDVDYRRARHVITENARVLTAVDILNSAGARGLGPVLAASHLSMRDDFEISVPELDLAVDASLAAGALGARMTGGGFGGTAIALVPTDECDAVSESVRYEFEDAGFCSPHIFSVTPSAGAKRDE